MILKGDEEEWNEPPLWMYPNKACEVEMELFGFDVCKKEREGLHWKQHHN